MFGVLILQWHSLKVICLGSNDGCSISWNKQTCLVSNHILNPQAWFFFYLLFSHALACKTKLGLRARVDRRCNLGHFFTCFRLDSWELELFYQYFPLPHQHMYDMSSYVFRTLRLSLTNSDQTIPESRFVLSDRIVWWMRLLLVGGH